MIPNDLLAGYRRFRAGRYAELAEQYRGLQAGQQPKTMVIGCADSRVDPNTIFSAGPGELFVVRNVAAMVPPRDDSAGYHGTSAAIEFAVTVLEVSTIVVMGHGQCGGVAAGFAATEDRPLGRYIGPWVALLADICADLRTRMAGQDPAALQRAGEQTAVGRSIDNLMSFDFVAEAVSSGRLAVHGAWFAIGEGTLYWLDQASGRFVAAAEEG